MSGHLPVEYFVGPAVLGLAGNLGVQYAGDLGGFGGAGLAEDRQSYHPPARCQPVGDPGLLAQQVEQQFPDLPAEVSGVGLAEVLGVLGEQTDEESTRPKVAVGQPASQDRTSGSISTSYSPVMHLMLY